MKALVDLIKGIGWLAAVILFWGAWIVGYVAIFGMGEWTGAGR